MATLCLICGCYISNVETEDNICSNCHDEYGDNIPDMLYGDGSFLDEEVTDNC